MNSRVELAHLMSAYYRKRKIDSIPIDYSNLELPARAYTAHATEEDSKYNTRAFQGNYLVNDAAAMGNLFKTESFTQAFPNSSSSAEQYESNFKSATHEVHEQDTDSGVDKHEEESFKVEKHDGDDDLSSCKGNYQLSSRICLVCGDRASGYNFNILSCESCKAFFRRNALKQIVPACLFAGSCKVEMHTRRFCTACRLNKCLQVGMKRSMILDDEAKKKRLSKMHQNRNQRSQGVPNPLSSASSSPKPGDDSRFNQTAQILPTMDMVAMPNPPSLPVSPVKEKEIKFSNEEPFSAGASTDTKPMLIGVMSLKLESSLVCVARPASGMPPLDGQELHFTEREALAKYSNRRVLTEDEWRHLSTLCNYYKEAFVSTANSSDLPHQNTTLNALVNLTGFMVRKMIRFAKRVVDYQTLDQAVQIALLKGSVVDTLYLHSAFHYDSTDECWYTPHGRVRTDILKQALTQGSLPPSCDLALSRTIYEEHCCFARSLKPLLDDDWNIVTLLLLITLFSPHRLMIGQSYMASNLPEPEAQMVLTAAQNQTQITNIQDKYLVLLKHYLESKYSMISSRTLMVQILQKLDELKQLTEAHGRVLLFADPTQIEPLMVEVFDLLITR